MRFDNRLEVAGTPQEVIALFADLPLMASFLPGASVGERNADGSYPATLTVAFGPKKIAFRGNLTNRIDRATLAGTLVGHASADLRGAKMSVTMDYRLASAAAGTEVTLVSEAELTGMLAEFAKTGGVVVTQALLAEFAGRFSAHVRSLQPVAAAAAGEAASEAGEVAAPAGGASSTPAAAPQALSMFALLLQVIKSVLRSLWPRSRG